MDFTVNNNIISAYGTINDGDGIAFLNLFQQIESNKKDITVKLHTYGGSVFDGNLIYNTIANSIANVQIHIVGIAASMGAIISLASDKVYIVENGYMMIHAPSGGVHGTANDLESNIKLMRSMEQNFISKLLEKTGKNQDGFVYRKIKGVETMACTMVFGPYEKIASAFLAFIEWISEQPEYRMSGKNRQICHRGPWNEKDPLGYLTEIQIPLKKNY